LTENFSFLHLFRHRGSLSGCLLVSKATTEFPNQTSTKKKSVLVVDEFDQTRKLSLCSPQKFISRQEVSVENGLKKMNI